MNINGNHIGDKDFNMSVSSNLTTGGVGGFTRAANQMNNLTQATMDRAMDKEGRMPLATESRPPTDILSRAWVPSNMIIPGKAEQAALLRAFSQRGNITSSGAKPAADPSNVGASGAKAGVDERATASTLHSYQVLLQSSGVDYDKQLNHREKLILATKGKGFDSSESDALIKKLKDITVKENVETKLSDQLQALKDEEAQKSERMTNLVKNFHNGFKKPPGY